MQDKYCKYATLNQQVLQTLLQNCVLQANAVAGIDF